MNLSLKEWARKPENVPKDEMYFKEAFWDQVMFARDELYFILAENPSQETMVVGTHTSKSVKLPVYYFKNSKFELWFRYNFHDWSITAKCVEPVNESGAFYSILMKEDPGGGCCFEGMDKFRKSWYFPHQGLKEFSTVTYSTHEMYMFCRTMRHLFGIKWSNS